MSPWNEKPFQEHVYLLQRSALRHILCASSGKYSPELFPPPPKLPRIFKEIIYQFCLETGHFSTCDPEGGAVKWQVLDDFPSEHVGF